MKKKTNIVYKNFLWIIDGPLSSNSSFVNQSCWIKSDNEYFDAPMYDKYNRFGTEMMLISFRYGESSFWRRSANPESKLVPENQRKWIFLKSVTIRLTSTDNNIFYYILLNGFITMIYWIYYNLLNSYKKEKRKK